MTVDLPTPPLPEPTQITFLTTARAPSGSPALAAEPLRERLLLLVGEHVEGDVHAAHAEARDLLVTAFSKWERIGQPGW